VSFAGGSSLVVFRGSEHPREALALVEHLSRPEAQAQFFHLSGNLPARRDAWEDSALAGDPKVQAFREQLDRVASPPHVPEIELIVTRVYEQAERAIRGGVPVPVVLTALDAQVNRILEKRRWVLDQQAAAGR
jgi:multiple sugar transport system substrate-binding protein